MINQQYYIIENGEQAGPFSLDELQEHHLTLDTQVSSSLNSSWQPASDLPELTSYFYAQGIYIVSEDNLAGFWWRLLAYIFDNFIISYLLITIIQVGNLPINIQATTSGSTEDLLKFDLLAIALTIVYNVLLEATPLRGSLGKYILRLAVIDAQGQKESLGRALVRNLGKLISSLALGIGFIAIFWSPYSQAWHDEMAKTYVIRKPLNKR